MKSDPGEYKASRKPPASPTGQPDPRGIAVVPGVDTLAHAELTAQDVGAAAGIDDPARRDLARLLLLRHVHGVRISPERNVLHPPSPERVGSRLASPPEQLVLEPAS